MDKSSNHKVIIVKPPLSTQPNPAMDEDSADVSSNDLTANEIGFDFENDDDDDDEVLAAGGRSSGGCESVSSRRDSDDQTRNLSGMEDCLDEDVDTMQVHSPPPSVEQHTQLMKHLNPKRVTVTPLMKLALKGQLKESGKELFSTNHCRAKFAAEKVAMGQTVVKHRNGKIDLGVLLEDGSERRHVCTYCNYTFAYRHVLERHIRQIHQKETQYNYQCPKCSYNTIRKDQMRAHFSVVHQNFKPFRCSECPFRAPKSFRVTAHINKNHDGVGAVIHDTDMRPRSVSPPPVVAMPRSKKSSQKVSASLLKQLKNADSAVSPSAASPSETELDTEQVKSDGFDPLEDNCFQCPFCDFRHSCQLEMGEHVLFGPHSAEAISV